MTTIVSNKVNALLGRRFPERRVFLRTDTDTKFIRLTPLTQFLGWICSSAVFAWAIIATAIILMDNVGSGNVRERVKREQIAYETRLNALSAERDIRAKEAEMAHERFAVGLSQISQMQTALLASEERRTELETGIDVIQTTLRRTIRERDAALAEAEKLSLTLNDTSQNAKSDAGRANDAVGTVDFLVAALNQTASQRDMMENETTAVREQMAKLELDMQLEQQRTEQVFSQLEDALTISVKPLDKMFKAVGLSSDRLIEQVRSRYSGQGGPSMPLSISTMGQTDIDPETLRANGIMSSLDRLNLYRIVAQKAPFSLPVKSAFRYTSGFGMRWGRMHKGTDFAAPIGTPVYATADGVVIKADWGTGYGRVIYIQHAFGLETRYAHLSKIRVKKGQRIARGQRIGDMGNSGHSTGSHLHYEIRVGGRAINPMTYIKAAKNVF